MASAGKNIEFSEVVGRRETYLRGHIEPSDVSLEVYVYVDELGLMREAKKWSLWERCDYPDQDQMLDSFIRALQDLLGERVNVPPP